MKKHSIPTFSFLIVFLFLLQSCNNSKISHSETIKTKPTEKVSNTEKRTSVKETNNQIEVFDANKMLFNGKVSRYFSLKEFEIFFDKADSTKLMSEEEPCAYIFENPDGSKDLEDKYLYKNGSRFENSKDKVAVDEFRFTKNNYLKYNNVILNSDTTINDLRKLFPNAVNTIHTLDVYGEGKLQVIQLREDKDNISDGHIKVFLKNGKLYFMHWWFPC
ncbi:hypothetical protein [Flavobacterium seoulense]|uniref:Lipoprotein n=1 Tax=Flavobacterium seoulense TaxID=1492738 RepID=A0A066WTQ7_9FLAO|nr:hypothetical protein [Flavobacterium seoulense]KDN54070.1 hypothetical protein FEM21_28870 [Flavobacterium seoulense]